MNEDLSRRRQAIGHVGPVGIDGKSKIKQKGLAMSENEGTGEKTLGERFDKRVRELMQRDGQGDEGGQPKNRRKAMSEFQITIEISTNKTSEEVRDCIFGFFDSYPDGMKLRGVSVRKTEFPELEEKSHE
jgi:hypothetical protein